MFRSTWCVIQLYRKCPPQSGNCQKVFTLPLFLHENVGIRHQDPISKLLYSTSDAQSWHIQHARVNPSTGSGHYPSKKCSFRAFCLSNVKELMGMLSIFLFEDSLSLKCHVVNHLFQDDLSSGRHVVNYFVDDDFKHHVLIQLF